MKLDPIYQAELEEMFKNPLHRGNIASPTVLVSEQNPLCGDNIKLQLQVENGVVQEAKFEGSACAVSIIASEKLLSFIEGKTVAEAESLTQNDLLRILGVDVSMSRIKCATLVLTALKKALADLQKKTGKVKIKGI